MNIFITLIFFLSNICFANITNPAGKAATYYSFELVPKEKLTLNIVANARCLRETPDQLTITDFESITAYPSTDDGKDVPVRIRHYYIESQSACPTSKQVTVGPYKEHMTHIKITTSNNVKIKAL